MKLSVSSKNIFNRRQKEIYTLKKREHNYEHDLIVFQIYGWDKIS